MIIAGGLLGWVLVWALGKYDAAWLESKNTFIVGGVVFGIIIGIVDFIRTAQRAMRDMQKLISLQSPSVFDGLHLHSWWHLQ